MYCLPIDVAYPAFSWAVWFSNGQFQALLRNADPKDAHLKCKEKNRYVVEKTFSQEGHSLLTGDEIRFEFSDYKEILKTKKLLEHQLTDYSVIIYHLDSTQLSNYTSNEINQIYTH